MSFRKLLAGTALALCLPVAQAQDRSWSNSDIALGVTSLALHAVDWGQTLTIARNPEEWRETNRILGDHPSVSEVNRYFLVYGALVAAAAHYFPEYRKVILALHIGTHAQAVGSNFTLGIKVGW